MDLDFNTSRTFWILLLSFAKEKMNDELKNTELLAGHNDDKFNTILEQLAIINNRLDKIENELHKYKDHVVIWTITSSFVEMCIMPFRITSSITNRMVRFLK